MKTAAWRFLEAGRQRLRGLEHRSIPMNVRPPFSRAAWLRFVFAAGAVIDGLAVVSLLSKKVSNILWGLPEIGDGFMRGYAATLMVGWTIVLAWAHRKPIERAAVAAFTAILIPGLVLTELVGALGGTLAWARVAPTLVLQAVLIASFAIAFHARPRRLVRLD